MLSLLPYLLIIAASMWGYHTIIQGKIVELERKNHCEISLLNQFSQYLANKLVRNTHHNDRRLDLAKAVWLSNMYSSILPIQYSNNNSSFIEKTERLVQLITLTTNRQYELFVDENILTIQLNYETRRKVLKNILTKCLSYRSQEMTYINIRAKGLFLEIIIESPFDELEDILTFKV